MKSDVIKYGYDIYLRLKCYIVWEVTCCRNQQVEEGC
jgi:hypothetical protein